jgi:mono/diheme cytochrome c family protein
MKIFLAAALALAFSTSARAQTMQPFYGGQIALLGHNHVEMIVHDGALRAWVRDHADKPVAASGKATVLAKGTKLEVPLKRDGAALVAEIPVKQGDKVTAILSLDMGSARFSQEAVVTPMLTGAAQAGAALYGQVCASCHGAALRGTEVGPPLLHPVYAPSPGHGDEIILSAPLNGAKSHHWKFGDMPKPDGVKPGQEKELLAFIRAMQSANGIGAFIPATAPAAAGHHGHH